MSMSESHSARPPLNPADIYRPRLGVQKPPLWKTAMAEKQAWLKMSALNTLPRESEQSV